MWKRIDVVFTIKSPLHIGYLPFKGSVIIPTRYYIIGRNFWGALTKHATEHIVDNPTKEYREIGMQIKDNFRFSYFYLYDNQNIFIPEFSEQGLIFGNNNVIDKSEFEKRFIGSRVLTAIDRDSGTAKDESLHEIEFINEIFIDQNEQIQNTKIIGCVWIKEGTKLNGKEIKIDNNGVFLNDFNLLEELTLGGEQGYGFGKVRLESILNNETFPIKSEHNDNDIKIILEKHSPILSHLKYDKKIDFIGDIELLTGRGYFDVENNVINEISYKKNAGTVLGNINYYFAPGTIVNVEEIKKIMLNWNGTLNICNDY